MNIARQKQTLTSLEKQHMKHPPGSVYIPNDDLDHAFTTDDIHFFEARWMDGWNLRDIARSLHRDPDEVFLLFFDRIRKKKHIDVRIEQLIDKGGVFDRGSTHQTEPKQTAF